MRMGSADEAMSLILGMMGPPADQMNLATHEQVMALNDSIRRIVAHYDTADGDPSLGACGVSLDTS